MDSRSPKLIFALLALYAAVHFSAVYPQLPSDSQFPAYGRKKPQFSTVLQALMSFAVLLKLDTADFRRGCQVSQSSTLS